MLSALLSAMLSAPCAMLLALAIATVALMLVAKTQINRRRNRAALDRLLANLQ